MSKHNFWHLTLTFDLRPYLNPSLARVKVDPFAKNQGCRSNGSAVRVHANGQTHRQTNGRYQLHYLPTSRLIKINFSIKLTILGLWYVKIGLHSWNSTYNPHTPSDYRHTDQYLWLVMVILCSMLEGSNRKAWQTNKQTCWRTGATKCIISLLF